MRLLLVSPMFPPQPGAGGLRMHALARAAVEAGHHVTVLTTFKRDDIALQPLPCDGFDVVEIEYRVPRALERLRSWERSETAGWYASSARDNGEAWQSLWRRGLRRIKQRSGAFSAVRMPDLTAFWVKPAVAWAQSHAQVRGRWDVVISSCGPYTAHLAGMKLKQLGVSKAWIADYRDLWNDNHLYQGLFPFTLFERPLELACLHAADMVTTVSEGLAAVLSRKARARVEVIYNGFEASVARQRSTCKNAAARNAAARLAYTGTFYPHGQDPRPLLRALRQVDAGSTRLVIAGRGEGAWRELAKACDVADLIEFRGVVSREEAIELQQSADALVLLDWTDARTGRGVLTAKVFEYIAAAAPVFVIGGNANSEVNHLLRRTGRGIHLGADVAAIANAIANLKSNDDAAIGLAPNHEQIALYTRQHQCSRMLELVRSLAACEAAEQRHSTSR